MQSLKNIKQSEVELVSMMIKILPLVKTDISSKTFEKLISTFMKMGTTKIEQLRLGQRPLQKM